MKAIKPRTGVFIAIWVGIVCFIAYAGLTQSYLKIKRPPEIEIGFRRVLKPYEPIEILLGPIRIIKIDQRLYQYPDGEFGVVCRYIFKTTDNNKPLAWHEPISREINGTLIRPVISHDLWLQARVKNSDWKIITTRGEATWHYCYVDGKKMLLNNNCNMRDIFCTYWTDTRVIDIGVSPQDGWHSTGRPRDVSPLHAIEVDIYLKRI